jgi:hypothetical protein
MCKHLSAVIADDEARAVVLNLPKATKSSGQANMNMYKGDDRLIGAIGSSPLSWLANRLPRNLRLMVVKMVCGR